MTPSKYFLINETACRCHCGFDIQPGFLRRLDELREKVGHPLVLSSGARCVAHNKAVGGAEHSRHIQGDAADITLVPLTIKQRYNLLKAALEMGLTVGVRADIYHIDCRPGQPLVFTYGTKE